MPNRPPEERLAPPEGELLTRFENTRPRAEDTTAVVADAKLRICFVVFDFIFKPMSSFTSVNASVGVLIEVDEDEDESV